MRFPLARPALAAALLTLAALGAAGCGSSSDDQAQTRTVITVIREVAGDSPSPDTADDGDAATDVSSRITEETDSTSGSSNSAASSIRVPNVVGKDHQLAQDTMQAAGLYNLSEEDATGQGRLLLLDRNWTVVSQAPKAGSLVNEDTTVTLRSKKDDE